MLIPNIYNLKNLFFNKITKTSPIINKNIFTMFLIFNHFFFKKKNNVTVLATHKVYYN